MSGEKILIAIKDICNKIIKDEDSSTHILAIKKEIAKGRYFEQTSFKELLEIAGSPSLSIGKLCEILKLLREIIDEPSGSKDFLISCLYSYIAEKKYRTDVLEEIVALSSFSKVPECKNFEALFYISEKLLAVVETKDQRMRLYQNYESILRRYKSEPNVSINLLNSMTRVASKFINGKKWDDLVEFLNATLIATISNQLFLIDDDKTFDEVLSIIIFLTEYGQSQDAVWQCCLLLTETLNKMLTNKEHKKCCTMLNYVLNMCCEKAITKLGLKQIKTNHFKTSKSSGSTTFIFQKTTYMIVKLFRDKLKYFEETAECLAAYHQLVVRMFHVLKFIKSEEGIISCCTDIKRHKIISAIDSVLSLAGIIVKAEKYDSSVASNVEYHVKYYAEICCGLKCKSKDSEMLHAAKSIYNLVLYFATNPSLLRENMKHLDTCITTMMGIYNKIPKEVKLANADLTQILSIYGKEKDKSTALISANGLAALLACRKMLATEETQGTKAFKSSQMRLMTIFRDMTQLLDFDTATDFINSDLFDVSKFIDTTYIPKDEFMLIEITAIFRYSAASNYEKIAKLFVELAKITNDLKILAVACQTLPDSTLTIMNKEEHFDVLKKVIKQFEDEKKKHLDFDVSLALAYCNYSIYLTKYASCERSEAKSRSLSQMIEELELNDELDTLKYLNESLCHFTDVICHLTQHKDDLDKITSTTRLLSIVRNIASQYFMRGIKYKDIEAFTLLWHLAILQGDSIKDLLNAATFFVDHQPSLLDSTGNYLKLSKKLKPLTIEEVFERANEALDKDYISSFVDKSPSVQSYILSYLLSLWVYLVSKKKKSAFLRWNQFKTLWETWKVPEDAANRVTIHAKMYFCLVEINKNCFNRSADHFRSVASSMLLSVTTYDHEFACQFYQILYRYSTEAVNHSMNRMIDMDHYEHAINVLIHSVVKNRFCIRTLELLSLSILRYLNMEKLDKAKGQLQDITKLLGLKQKILVDSPYKAETVSSVLAVNLQTERIRKNVVAPSSPIHCEISTLYKDNSELLNVQLESFIHKASCKCEICKAPQLKFVMFQVGCHYSRLMWLTGKWNVSQKFNEFALEPWRNVCDKLRRSKDSEFLMINKVSFAVYSIRWLFQCADTLIRMNRLEDVEEIYEEINLICTTDVPDYESFKQVLFCRKENLNYLIEKTEVQQTNQNISFKEFLKLKTSKKEFKRGSASKSSKPPSLIYIDLSDEDSTAQAKIVPKTARKPKSSPTDTNLKSEIKSKEKTIITARRAKLVDVEQKDDSSSSSSASSSSVLRSSRRRMI